MLVSYLDIQFHYDKNECKEMLTIHVEKHMPIILEYVHLFPFYMNNIFVHTITCDYNSFLMID